MALTFGYVPIKDNKAGQQTAEAISRGFQRGVTQGASAGASSTLSDIQQAFETAENIPTRELLDLRSKYMKQMTLAGASPEEARDSYETFVTERRTDYLKALATAEELGDVEGQNRALHAYNNTLPAFNALETGTVTDSSGRKYSGFRSYDEQTGETYMAGVNDGSLSKRLSRIQDPESGFGARAFQDEMDRLEFALDAKDTASAMARRAAQTRQGDVRLGYEGRRVGYEGQRVGLEQRRVEDLEATRQDRINYRRAMTQAAKAAALKAVRGDSTAALTPKQYLDYATKSVEELLKRNQQRVETREQDYTGTGTTTAGYITDAALEQALYGVLRYYQEDARREGGFDKIKPWDAYLEAALKRIGYYDDDTK
jgi:hypothetical protein